MKTKSILLVVAAFVLGAVAAGSIGVRVIREVRTDDEATSLPDSAVTTTIAAPSAPTYQVDPDETMIGSTAMVPTSLQVSGARVAIEYDLVLRAPYGGVDGLNTFIPGSGLTLVDVSELNHVWPTLWEIETTDGVFEGGAANPTVRVARFDVDEGFSPGEVIEVRIIEARTPVFSNVPFTLSNDSPRSQVAAGVAVELLGISDQGASTIVQVEIDADDPMLASAFVRGDGPGWRSAVLEAEGRPRVNLTYVGEELPNPIPLVAAVEEWVVMDGTFAVGLEGLR